MNIYFDLSEYKEPSIKDRIENPEYSIKYIDKGIEKIKRFNANEGYKFLEFYYSFNKI